MSALAATAQFHQAGPQSYYQRAIGGLRDIASRFTRGLSAASSVKEPVKKWLHMATPSFPTLQSLFFLGSEIDGSNRYAKQSIDTGLIQSLLPTGVEAREILLQAAAAKPRLEQLRIQPSSNPIMNDFHFFSGIRSSAYYKLDGATAFAQAGIPARVGDYRGYGASFGQADVSSESLVEDAKLMLLHTLNRNKSANALGHSLGSAIASRALAELSDEHEIRSSNFVAVSSWNSFESLVEQAPWIGWKPFTPLLRSKVKSLIEGKFNTGDNICRIIDNMVASYQKRAPAADENFRLIIVHGAKDNHVSPEHADELCSRVRTHIAQNVPNALKAHFKVDFLPVSEAGHFTAKHRDGVIPWQKLITMLKTG